MIAAAARRNYPLLTTTPEILDSSCYNLDRLQGDQLCISPPGDPYVDPSPTTLAPSTAITPAPVPTDVGTGTNRRCGEYYKVQPGEFCNLPVLRFAISLDDFYFLSPSLNANCTILLALESYCIKPVSDSMISPAASNQALPELIYRRLVNTYDNRPSTQRTMITSIPFRPPTPIALSNTKDPVSRSFRSYHWYRALVTTITDTSTAQISG